MAGENDGSIIIDTELDNTGFQKGSEQLRKAIADTANAFDNFGDNVMTSFNKVIPLLQSIAGSASQISAALTGTATQTEAATEKVVSSEQRVKQSAEDAAAAVNRQGEAASEFNGKVSNTQNTVSALEREVNSLSSGLQSVSNSAEMGFANGKAVIAFDTKLQEMEQRLATAREHLAAFGSTQIPTEAYTSLSQQIEKAEQALFKLYDRRDDLQALGVKENSAQWQRLALQIENAEAQLARYERERDSLTANGGAFVNGSQTAEYARMETALNNAGSALDRNKSLIDQEALAQARLNVLTAQEAVEAAGTSSEREAALERLRTAQQELNDLASSMSNKPGNMEPSEESISGWQRFGAAIKSAASAALRMTGSLAKIGFSAIKKGISGIVGKLKEFTKQGHKSRSMAETLTRSLTSLKTILVSRIKSMFISSIFNEAKESLQELAQFSGAFNQSMSNIKNSAKGLSANLAVSLGGLISAVEPVLTKVINMISTAVSYLNAFFAMLSGKSVMAVAKKQTDSYAKSLGGAAGAAEELKRQIYGFDELNKRSDNNSGNGGGGSGGGAGDLFEEVPIDSLLPDSVKEFFQSIKDAIASENWREVGEIIASGLNSAMTVVDDWINSTFRPWGVKWAANVAEVLNGLTDGLDWNLLGRTIADGLNSIADIYNTFMDTYDFERLGKGLGDALNGLVDNIEWENIGKAFAQKWQALIELIHGFVRETNWANLGTNIGKALQSWFDTIDWGMLGGTISTGIRGLIQTITAAIHEMDWGQIGVDIADFINNIDWWKIATDLWGLLKEAIAGVWEAGVSLFENLDFGNSVLASIAIAVGAVATALTTLSVVIGIVNAVMAASPITWIIAGITALIAAIVLCIKYWDEISVAITNAWNTVKDFFAGVWQDIVDGFINPIKEFFSNIGTWIKEHIFQPFINGFKKAFGIHSPSTVMQEQGNFVIEGLLNGITETWNKITAFFSTALSNLKATLSNAWNSIKTTASNTWSSIKTNLTNTVSNIKTNISNAWDNIKSKSSAVWDGVKSTVSTSFTNLKNSLQNTADTVKSNLSTAWDNVKSTASTKWENIKSAIATKWNALKTTLNNTDWKSVGSNVCSGIKNGIESGWNTLKNKVSNLASNLLSSAKNALGIASPSKVFRDEVGKFISLGLAEGIEDTQSAAVRSVKKLAEATVDNFDADGLTIGAPTSATVSGLDTVADKLSGIAEVFKEITSSILAIDGLRVPEIALGKVIPMRTKVDTSTLSNVELSGFDGFTSDMDEYMMEQSGVLKQILELLRRLKPHINMDDLTAAITAKQAATARSFGGV